MAHTNRKHKYNAMSKENKEARKFTSRELRRANRAYTKAAMAAVDLEALDPAPVHQKTSGWQTW